MLTLEEIRVSLENILKCETDIRKRYDFSHNKFQGESCIKAGEWTNFKPAPAPSAQELSLYPNGARNKAVIDALNGDAKLQHNYYQFFEGAKWGKNPCVIYPPERLFNNITKRSMLPNQHFRNIEPVYLS